MDFLYYLLSALKIINREIFKKNSFTDKYVQFSGQTANDTMRERLSAYFSTPKGREAGFMATKFGTYELDTVLYFHLKNKGLAAMSDMANCVRPIYWHDIKKHLPNTGFFPLEEDAARKLSERYLADIPQIDILASYIRAEAYLKEQLGNAQRVDLEGYYAPFLWQNPWTKVLRGKKVLVVHPFAQSIRRQYEKREFLFQNPDVLPEFGSLLTVQAVQSIAGNKPEQFATWFDALKHMEEEISTLDFDVALVGCGAYGLPLAAHIKRMGKGAIHLAGWTQMLFGIYGNRWLQDQPQFKPFINEHWVRPDENERPKNLSSVENGCYW